MRKIDGHGDLIHRFPEIVSSPSATTSLPFSSTSTISRPGMGSVAQLGFEGVIPAKLEIKQPPVSVCHQVSTIGQRPLPTF